jgi:hypothetical protein
LGGNHHETAKLAALGLGIVNNEVVQSQGAQNFFVFGVVRYGDIFGAEYETEFAYFTNRVKLTVRDRPIKMSRPDGRFVAFRMTKPPRHQAEKNRPKWWQLWKAA